MKRTILKLTAFAVVLAISFTVHAAVLQDEYVKELKDVKGIRSIVIDNVNGDCVIIPGDSDVVRIEGAIRIKGGSDEECRDYYRKAEIKVTTEGEELVIDVIYPKTRGFFSIGRSVNMRVDFEITVPVGLDIGVDLVNGDVTLEKMGDCNIDLVNGDVIASEINSIVVDVVNGSIEVREVAETVSCDLVNGSLKLFSSSEKLRKVVADSVNGTMQVHVPASVLGRIHMSSATGITYLKEEVAEGEWKVKMKSKSVTMVDDGNARINLENVNGKIVLFCKR